MGLDATIRAAIVLAATAVDDLLCDVGHRAFVSQNSDGVVTYNPAPPAAATTRKAFVMSKSSPLFRLTGIETIGSDSALFVGNVPVDRRDEITLPDGSKPQIADVEGVRDPTGGTYYTWVKFGRPERGSLGQ